MRRHLPMIVLVPLILLIALPAVAQEDEEYLYIEGDLDQDPEAVVELAPPPPGLPIDGPWRRFTWDPGYAPIPINQTPFLVNATTPVVLKITDSFINDDRFRVSDNMELLGLTSIPLSPGDHWIDGLPPHLRDIAFHSPRWSSGAFRLCPGEHRIRLRNMYNQHDGGGAGFIRVITDPKPNPICDLIEAVEFIEAKADVLEAKADVFEAKADALEVKADALEVKADALDAQVVDIKAELVDVKAEVVVIAADLAMAREERITYACMTQEWVAKYFLPASKGGIITEVRDLVTQRVADIAAVGEDTFGAESTISQGNSKLNRGQYKQAYQKYCVALCRASVRNTEVAACGYWD